MSKPRGIANEILRLRAEGKNYAEIVNILGCSKSTVSYHCGTIRKINNIERMRIYRENKKNGTKIPCLQCQSLSYHKFCSRKCFQKSIIKKDKSHKCQNCPNIISGEKKCLRKRKFCDKCYIEYRYSGASGDLEKFKLITIGKFRADYNLYHAHAKIRGWSRKIYENQNKDIKCKICGYSFHCEICHIKSICDFPDTATIYEINHIDNLVALCPNHHVEFDRGHIKL